MKITIRPWKLEDASNLSLALNNKKILDNLRDGLPYPYTSDDAKFFIEIMLKAKKETQYSWAITINDKAIGSIGVFRKENIHSRTAEMGYYIAEEYWGKGIGTIAIKQARDYIFSKTNIIRIFSEPFSSNIASCRILEKSGFFLEGILRKNAVKNGVIIDTKIYSIIKEPL